MRAEMFFTEDDYAAFERVLGEADHCAAWPGIDLRSPGKAS